MVLYIIIRRGCKFVDEAIHENNENWAPTKYYDFTVREIYARVVLIEKPMMAVAAFKATS